MTFQTRTIAKRTGFHCGDDRSHVNRIKVSLEPWPQTELEPELKPEHQRPVPGKFEAISVRTPTVAKVRVLQPDRFAQWDQDVLADEWKALCRREGHMRGLPLSTDLQRQRGSAGGLVSQQHDGLPDYMARALRHFSRGDDTTNGMAAAIKMSDSRGKEAVRKLRSYGFIRSSAPGGGRCFHAITQLGLEAICK
jgi:hypothetical protein